MTASSRVVLFGDIGREEFYHLGDEAMTEAAIEQLRQRGISDLVLVATDPGTAEEFYGFPAVERFGFWTPDSDETFRRKLHNVLTELKTPPRPGSLHEAIAAADALVICGGGNMNSRYGGPFLERYAAYLVARNYGVPLFVAGQTVGPRLSGHQRAQLAEMLNYASCFAARENATYELLREIDPRAPVTRSLDDAALLTGSGRGQGSPYRPDRPYAVASFSNPYVDRVDEDQARKIAKELDSVAETLDCEVVLSPHAGRFLPGDPVRDQLLNTAVVEFAEGGRISASQQLTAREYMQVVTGAEFVICTRYHPVVFATVARVPVFPIGIDNYCRTRARGALENFGQEATFVPLPLWESGHTADFIADTLAMLEEGLRDDRTEVEELLAYQRRWWDAVADAMVSGEWRSPGNTENVSSMEGAAVWAKAQALVDDVVRDLWDERRLRLHAEGLASEVEKISGDNASLASDLIVERRHISHLRADLFSERERSRLLARALENVRRRKAIRVADAVGSVVRRLR